MPVMSWKHALLVATLLLLPPQAAPQPPSPGTKEQIADGVLLHTLDDQALLSPPGPIAVQALQLDPRKVRLTIALAATEKPAREPVASIAARHKALAAVNGGFFVLASGAPAGLLKADGKIIGWSNRPRGTVGILNGRNGASLLLDRVTLTRPKGRTAYTTRFGSSTAAWTRAPDILGGAGLLLLDGREIDDWTEEIISAGFDTTRHPRTMVGVDGEGAIWLVTVDGRQPSLSLGMNFAELKTLARRLGLRSALNLDGGGSTTMVVKDRIVNHPSDATGPRPVGDAILVFTR